MEQTNVLKKQVAEREAQLTEAKSSTTTAPAPAPAPARNSAPPRASTGATAQLAREHIPPIEGICWGCGAPGHRLWACPELSNAEKRKLDRRKICPIGEHSRPVCIIVKYRGRQIPALVDTGWGVTVTGSALAKKHHWKIRPAELQSVKAADNEHMLIEGVASVSLAIGKRSVRHEIHITPDLDELIIGSDWMAKQGRLTWDYATEQVRFRDGNEWIALHRELPVGCQRVIVEMSTVLSPRQETKCPSVLLAKVAEPLPVRV